MKRQSGHKNRFILVALFAGPYLAVTLLVDAVCREEINAEISIMIIPSVNNTFGYDILASGKQIVHQPHVPGHPENNRFTTPENASKVADLVVKKIRNNEMLPAIVIEELKKLEVLK